MDKPKIEFPCHYPIKIIVDNESTLIEAVLEFVKKYDADIDDKVVRNPSKKGNFVSLRIQFWATGADQLDALFTDLKTVEAVRMVL